MVTCPAADYIRLLASDVTRRRRGLFTGQAIYRREDPLLRRARVKRGSFPERIGLPQSIQRNEPRVYHTTGLSSDEITELCGMICSAERETGGKSWPPSLGLFKSVVVTLTYLRRNRVQEELAETYATSQPTI